MRALVLEVCKTLERENIPYCLMRDGDQLEQLLKGGEVDLLILENRLASLQDLLSQLSFRRLPSGGYAPHHFFVAYDRDSQAWLKLDVVTEVAYGRPIPALRTALGDHCLSHRRRSGPVFVPAPEDELVTLLLHCVLDKECFAPTRRRRLQALCRQIGDEQHLAALLADHWSPTMSWSQLAALIEAENWTALLAERKTVISRLAGRAR